MKEETRADLAIGLNLLRIAFTRLQATQEGADDDDYGAIDPAMSRIIAAELILERIMGR